jgi:arginine utilization protein RocB
VVREHFEAISDLSYMGFQGNKDDLVPLAANTPGWGEVYDLPLDTLLKLDVPVVNIGASGRDAHKYTERLDLKYYLGAYPDLFRSFVKRVSKMV